MVNFEKQNDIQRLVITANRSMSWQQNKRILAFMFCVNMAIALGWAAMGAWMILPFAGLEIALVGLGMYYVSWKLSFKEIIIIEGDSLILQKGIYMPKQQWQWQLGSTTLIKQPSRYRMSAPALFLKHLNQTVEIGSALNRNEKKELREHLIRLGLGMRVVAAK
ncbi:MAG: putative membrane protein [Arenicella sp.]|jgi:uncharacterized membrane protein